MQTTSGGLAVSTISTRVADPPLELYVTEEAFLPNPTTVRFARTVRIEEGDVVFDIGTGVGPLALAAAMKGARQVYAVDPVPMDCELARSNVAKFGFEETIHVYQGCFFEPFELEPELKGVKADVIVADVSGIADPVGRALGWYSPEVPTGGVDGTDVVIEVIRQAPKHLASGGTVYFPIAIDLSDSDKILDAARSVFMHLANAMERPTTHFPMTEDDLAAIDEAYGGNPPSYITIQREGRRVYWRGQIWKASEAI